MIESFETLTKQISEITTGSLIQTAIYSIIVYYISNLAKFIIPRLIAISIAVSFLVISAHVLEVIVGLAILAPHLKFFIWWLINTYYGIKNDMIDSYILFLNIYFKIRRFILWFYDTYQDIKAFIKNRGRRTEQDNQSSNNQQDYYQQQEEQTYSEYGHSGDNKERYRQRKREKEQEREQERKQKEQEERDAFMYEDEYKQFFSTDHYTVLGVSRQDDLKTIKKKYRELCTEYHHDNHYKEDPYKYTKIMQQLNGSYRYIKKYHGTQ